MVTIQATVTLTEALQLVPFLAVAQAQLKAVMMLKTVTFRAWMTKHMKEIQIKTATQTPLIIFPTIHIAGRSFLSV